MLPTINKPQALVFFALGLSVSLIGNVLFQKQNGEEKVFEVRRQENYKYINPLIECDSNAISKDKNLSQLKNKLQDTIDEKISKGDVSFASVYYRDLNNGPWIGLNEHELFSPASLIKVPVMMAYYKMAEADPSILDKELINTRVFDPTAQNIQPEKILEKNKAYTVRELVERMIIYSDNLAYDLLIDHIEPAKIIKVYQDLGIDLSLAVKNPNGNILSVKDYASFYRILFNSSYLNKDMSEKALELLTKTKFKKALASPIPGNVTVAHKFGERQYTATKEKQLHDCGIVYLPNKPYLLCIMTRGKDFNAEAATIRQISKEVYQELSEQINQN